MLQGVADERLEEVLGQLHVVLQLVEGHLGLDHPELGEVARRVGVLGAERGAERVDAAQGQRTQLAFELARHGEVARLAEEVLRIVHLALPGFRNVVQIERRHVEHGAGALAVRGRDERRVEVVESVAVEVVVDGIGHGVADAQHGAERIGARTQVGDVAQEFERMTLFLEGIGLGIGRTVERDRGGLHLDALARAERLDESSVHTQAGARGHGAELLLADLRQIDHHLNVRCARAVVQGDERHVLVAALGAHPSLNGDVGIHDARFQNFSDSLSLHICNIAYFHETDPAGSTAPGRPAPGTAHRIRAVPRDRASGRPGTADRVLSFPN